MHTFLKELDVLYASQHIYIYKSDISTFLALKPVTKLNSTGARNNIQNFWREIAAVGRVFIVSA